MNQQLTVWRPDLPAPTLYDRVVDLVHRAIAALRGQRYVPRRRIPQNILDARLVELEDRVGQIADYLVSERRKRAVGIFKQLEQDLNRGNLRRAKKLLEELAGLANI